MLTKIKIPLIHLTVIFIALSAIGIFNDEKNQHKPQKLDARLEQLEGMVNQRAYGDIRNSAIEESYLHLEDAQSEQQKLQVAMDSFLGFLMAQLIRETLCEEAGVNIATFMVAILNDHAREISILRSNHYDYEVILDQWESEQGEESMDLAEQIIAMDMKLTANRLGGDIADACQLYNQSSAEISAALHFSKSNPEMHAALLIGEST